MRYEQAKKKVIKKMQWLSPKHGMHNVFRDFTVLAACTISNSIDKQRWQKREDMYMWTIKKYNKEEANIFAEILALVTLGLNNRMGDFMGELYMELEISNKNSGQFFTPYDVSKIMAELVDVNLENEIVTLNEPAVGAGGMIIAYAEVMKERGLNYQTQLKVICNDIDYDVVKMCYIQLSLLGIDAVVMQGNTITLEMNEVWYTPMHIINLARKQKEERGLKTLVSIKKAMKFLEENENRKELEPVQMSLF